MQDFIFARIFSVILLPSSVDYAIFISYVIFKITI